MLIPWYCTDSDVYHFSNKTLFRIARRNFEVDGHLKCIVATNKVDIPF